MTLGRLHVITDTTAGNDPIAVADQVLRGGAPVIQIRVDDSYTDRAAFDLVAAIVALCRRHGATCLVNNRLHLALAAGADGGHVGEHDLPAERARAILGPQAVVGATCRDPEAAIAAQRAGASYLGVGPSFPTSTKAGLPDALGPEGVGRVAAAVDIPVIAIGGVDTDRVGLLRAAGAWGVAVVGAVWRAADPRRATVQLLDSVGRK